MRRLRDRRNARSRHLRRLRSFRRAGAPASRAVPQGVRGEDLARPSAAAGAADRRLAPVARARAVIACNGEGRINMRRPRRKFLRLAAGVAALLAVPRFAQAQAYPSRPVRIVVGFAPGGPNDLNARLIGQWLSERLGQPFIIDNRPSASGNIAMESVVRSPPDGYTLVMVAVSSAINATLFENQIGRAHV